MPKGRLNDAMRAFIVEQVACYTAPKETADSVFANFGVEITPQNVELYDPTKQAGKACAKKWKELFAKTRRDFLDHVEKRVPMANKAVRVQKLSRAATIFESSGNLMAMAEMSTLIAKEMGNVHTNRHELTGAGGGSIKTENQHTISTNLDEIRAEIARLGYVRKPAGS